MSGLRQYANEQRHNLVYWQRRRRYRHRLPALNATDRALLDALERDGGVVTSLDALALAGTPAMLAAGDALMAAIKDRPAVNKGAFAVQPTQDEIGAYPELIRWGLEERLLALVTNYIGLPVTYRGLAVRRDFAGGDKVETRLFHRDNEDNRIVKIIVYLNDVGEAEGAYEFIPRRNSPASWRIPVSVSRASDEAVARLVPRSRWVPCTGRRGTVVLTDTCSVFHRGRIAETEDRQTLFFAYNSTMPISPQWCQPLFDRDRFRASMRDLSPTQLAAISATY
jgi:hypothetical protein